MSMEVHYIIHSLDIFLPLLTFSVEYERAYLLQAFSFSSEAMENAMDIWDPGLFSSGLSVGLLFPGGHICSMPHSEMNNTAECYFFFATQ